MRNKILSVFLLSMALLFSCITYTYAQSDRYEVKKVCFGTETYAAVVEYNQQYYVIVSKDLILKNYIITDIFGLFQSGGNTNIRYYNNNIPGEMNVQVLSRFRWKYSGFPGARAVCRIVANRGL